MIEGLRSAGRLLRPMPHEPEISTPPPNLPPARIIFVPGHGEIFVREQEGPNDVPPVLLLHGWTASADTTWFAVYKALEGRHAVIAIDQRGHGRGIRAEEPFTLEACAEDAAALLEHLEMPAAIIAGYSLGGAVALLMYQHHRERVAGLVMAATAYEWRSTIRERVLWRIMGVFEFLLRMGTGDGFVQRYLHYAVGHSPEVKDLRAWVGGEFKRGFPNDIAEAGRALSAFDAKDWIYDVEVPCASVVTTRDRLVMAREQCELAEALGAPAFYVDGDHDAPLVKPKEFSTAVVQAIEAVAEKCRTS